VAAAQVRQLFFELFFRGFASFRKFKGVDLRKTAPEGAALKIVSGNVIFLQRVC
jgi:hypothetical protein